MVLDFHLLAAVPRFGAQRTAVAQQSESAEGAPPPYDGRRLRVRRAAWFWGVTAVVQQGQRARRCAPPRAHMQRGSINSPRLVAPHAALVRARE